jgi:hypothetical protein
MENEELPVKNFGPVLVFWYTLVVAGVTFALNIAMGVKIGVVVVAAIVFSLVLGRSKPGHPPFGTEADE